MDKFKIPIISTFITILLLCWTFFGITYAETLKQLQLIKKQCLSSDNQIAAPKGASTQQTASTTKTIIKKPATKIPDSQLIAPQTTTQTKTS